MKQPLWTPQAIEYVDRYFQTRGIGRALEFGGGHSTLWLADRARSDGGAGPGEVVVVEGAYAWQSFLRQAKCDNIRLIAEPTPYAHVADRFEDESFDLVAIDGRDRIECIRRSMRLVKHRGCLLLDDSQRGKYDEAFRLLHGWHHSRYRGKKPTRAGTEVDSETTIWTRPFGYEVR